MYRKLTVGYVVQEYDDNGHICSQEFIAGDTVEYEDAEGGSIEPRIAEEYFPFTMVQP